MATGDDADVDLIDLTEVALPFLDEPDMPARGNDVEDTTKEGKNSELAGVSAPHAVMPGTDEEPHRWRLVQVVRRLVFGQLLERDIVLEQAGAAEVVAERREVDAAAHQLGRAHRVHRRQHVRLCLDHLVVERILQLLAREPDESESEQVVEI